MQIAVNIVSLSSSYICFALGLALVFGVMRVINFAYGELYMAGAYASWMCVTQLNGSVGLAGAYLIGFAAAATATGVLGLAMYAAVIRPLSNRPLGIFVATLALSYMIQVLVVLAFGPIGQSMRAPFPGVVRLGSAILPWQRVPIIVTAVCMVVALWFFLQRTRVGRAVRALSQNERGAVLQGINERRIRGVTFALSAVMAGLAGAAVAPLSGVNPFMAGDVLWKSFIVIIVGGIGSIWGTIAASIMFGTLDTVMSATGAGRYLALTSALVMLAVLAVRPSGLFGESE